MGDPLNVLHHTIGINGPDDPEELKRKIEAKGITVDHIALHYIMPVISTGVCGIAMEWVQGTIPQRSAESLDVIADITGAILAVTFMITIWPGIKRTYPRIASIL